MARLIVGLGNPGRDYAETRHNVGFMVLDRLAAAVGASFQYEKKRQADIATARVGGSDVWLCKPQTYMNLSGESVSSLTGFYKVAAADVLVVLDDLALPLGRLRLRESGSSGGQNGLKNILLYLGTQNVPRIRIGIGAPAGSQSDASGHVLGKFALAERPVLEESLANAVDAVQLVQTQGFAAAMNRYNQQPKQNN
jgi:PTH1 family peptidyl-tRNA hydrolase